MLDSMRASLLAAFSTFAATLLGANNVPIANATIAFSIAGNVATATTNASGVATVSYVFPQGGTFPVIATFSTDGVYNDVSARLNVLVKPMTTGRLV